MEVGKEQNSSGIDLSIVIPAYNEELRLPPVLEAYGRFFSEKMGSRVEILVVVNGSKDRTAEVAGKIADRFPVVRVLEEQRAIGKGGAVLMGMRAARGAFVGFVDADGATSVTTFGELFEQAQDVDGAIASRWAAGSDVELPQKALRQLASRVFNLLTFVLFGLRYKDTQCGAKIFRGEPFRKILPRLGITEWAFDVDVLFHLRRIGCEIMECPTVWKDVEGSKIVLHQAAYGMAVSLIRLRLIYSPFRWVVRLYDRVIRSSRRRS